jgi:CNP1-like family protein
LRRWLLAALAAGCSSTPQKSDWEKSHGNRLGDEEKLVMPAYPRKENLVEINVSATAEFSYYVDAASLAVGKDRVVRYVLVARSPQGAENVSYEAIRCPDQHRLYATGQRDGTWSERVAPWREITRGTALGWPYALARYYFCPHRDPIQSAAEGVDALRRGVHPAVRVETFR